MEALFNWNYFVALLLLLYAGGEVRCDCTEENIKINGGHYTLTKHLDKDSWLVYHCPEGYYPYPHFRHSCQPGGNWEPAPSSHQKCKLVQCPDPTVLQDGFITPQLDTYFVTNVTTFECRAGFTMRGSSSRTCLPNGKWSGDTTICSRDSMSACADPGVPPGASRTGNTFEIGNKVKYACNEDLFLVGSSERVCQENGYWTGKEPACYYKYTYDTARDVSENFGRKIKDILTMPQPEDVKQEGKTIRIAKNGTLNIYIGLDVSPGINEDHIKGGIEAIKTFIQKVSSFSVSPNYEIFFFTSEIHEVVNIMDFMDSQHNSPASVISKLESFKLPKTTGTNINLAFRTVEERMAIIKVRVGQENFKEHRHVIILLTDGAYNMGGNPLPTVARIKRMAYMGQTDGSRDEYLDIYVFAIGIDIFDDDLQPLTAGTGGQHYFRLRDVTNLQETFDEIIVAVTENFLCTGGIDLYREHIACLSDAGGAVFKDYKLRTIQIGLVSWGTQPMCASGGLFESSEDSRDFHINLFRMVPFLKSILGKDDQDDYEPLKFLS
ncbi:unnamed protein product [Menidia menidia]|uniref:(Atlantic silverside) hypothetical protein n=1 Tax=Menidia menidia TaxID=238744 RepID=A0A8S4AI27_9TELE|nr:unnamed protein product [Menidia menidia]